MFRKIFGIIKGRNNLPLNPVQPRALQNPMGQVENRSRAVKIVHAGGHVERHYMAVPARRIIDKYPTFILARPEIFRRPWGTIVGPDEVLVPGQKYYIVPHKTVRKLKQKFEKGHHSGFSYESKSRAESDSGHKDGLSISSILVKSGPKVKARNLHVSFMESQNTSSKSGSDQISISSYKKSRSKGEKGSKKRLKNPPHMNGKYDGRARNEIAWEPSLNSIFE